MHGVTLKITDIYVLQVLLISDGFLFGYPEPPEYVINGTIDPIIINYLLFINV